MKIKTVYKLALITSITVVCYSAYAQEVNNCYCQNTLADTNLTVAVENKIYIEKQITKDSIFINIVNSTRDTVYLFKSYFQKDLYSSKYIHRIDTKKKNYYITFIPLIPYLSTQRTDNLVLSQNRIIKKNQILYDFIKVAPQTHFKIAFYLEDLFKNVKTKNNITRALQTSSLNKFSYIKFKSLTSSCLIHKYNLFFSFAFYNHIDIVCRKSDFYLNEFNFNSQAKSFHIISTQVPLNDERVKFLK